MATTPHTPSKPTTPPPAAPPAEPEAGLAPGAVPPRWEPPPPEAKPAPDWSPEPSLDPRSEKAPEGVYADSMPIAVEQRARSAWIEAHGLEKWDEAVDERPAAERPKFEKAALAGGGAFVKSGEKKQVPGVAPPTKRE
ncbi:MAG TPA: hypothetical protein VGG68_15710 [Caulobacteraceae bacterium]|jgi:hypothetical protein